MRPISPMRASVNSRRATVPCSRCPARAVWLSLDANDPETKAAGVRGLLGAPEREDILHAPEWAVVEGGLKTVEALTGFAQLLRKHSGDRPRVPRCDPRRRNSDVPRQRVLRTRQSSPAVGVFRRETPVANDLARPTNTRAVYLAGLGCGTAPIAPGSEPRSRPRAEIPRRCHGPSRSRRAVVDRDRAVFVRVSCLAQLGPRRCVHPPDRAVWNHGRRMPPFVELREELARCDHGLAAVEGQIADGDAEGAPLHRHDLVQLSDHVVAALEGECCRDRG